MDLEGSYTKGSQSGRGRLRYIRYIPGKMKIDLQVNKFTTQRETEDSKSNRGFQGKK